MPEQGNGGVRATNATLANGTANLDGNGQSICSWGQVIQEEDRRVGMQQRKSASPRSADKLPLADPATGGLMAGAPAAGASAASAASPLPSTAASPLSQAPTLLFQVPKFSAGGVGA